MSAMRDMSRAIRMELSEFGPTLRDLPDETLRDLTEIVGAFFYDMVGEQDRRGWGSARPAATVAATLKRYRDGLEQARDELGVPDESYPAPVANAVEIINAALSEEGA